MQMPGDRGEANRWPAPPPCGKGLTMTEDRVMAVGFVVMLQVPEDGFLTVRCWTRLSGSMSSTTEDYTNLTYLEAMELVNVHADNNRPGWAVGDGWSQPPLMGA